MHSAGAFGEDDKVVTDREGIEPVMPVGKDGRFTHPVDEYAGMLVFDANLHIIDHLKAATAGAGDAGSVSPGTVLLRRESYTHSYPHCWRCREPLIYKGVSSWFVEVTAIKQRMLELNEQIRWVPDHIKHGQFGRWLENARDWSITRNRFWGSPVPVWRSDDEAYPRLDVYGSFEELERDFGVAVTDLHRPFVDELTRPNPDDPTGRSTMRRVPDVLDVWFDSGSMSFAQVHYPFENTDWFEHHFPGDFIVEYIGQTRGWFYTLHILASAIFDRPAFSTCLSPRDRARPRRQQDVEVAAQLPRRARGLRPRRRRCDAMVPDVVADPARRQPDRHRAGDPRLGAPGADPAVEQLVRSSRSTPTPPRTRPPGARTASDPMDRYILAKLRGYVAAMTDHLDNYEVASACDDTRWFLDVLTNWYIRRSRERFWEEDADAFDTLYTVLETVCRVTAPLLPLTAEEIWRGLTAERSVHLTDWPSPRTCPPTTTW